MISPRPPVSAPASCVCSVWSESCASAGAEPKVSEPNAVPAKKEALKKLRFVTGIILTPSCSLARPVCAEIGRASCRERVCQYVYLSGVAVSLKKKIKQTKNHEIADMTD